MYYHATIVHDTGKIAYLLLDDGSIFPRTHFNAGKPVDGEIVVQIDVVELLTDPSCYTQIVVLASSHENISVRKNRLTILTLKLKILPTRSNCSTRVFPRISCG